MRIRTRLLMLMLVAALVPLIVCVVIHRISMRRLGREIAQEGGRTLQQLAADHLQTLVDDYGKVIAQRKVVMELAVHIQAREVEQRLAAPPPAKPPHKYFNVDYSAPETAPPDLRPSTMHQRIDPDGKPAPLPVSHGHQVIHLAPGVSRDEVDVDLSRLATMPQVYAWLRQWQPEAFYWQYTSLASGIHTSYPGHGGYPELYDPREREWYILARETAEHAWTIMPEVSTSTIALTVAAKVHRPDGAFAGVTAIDIPLGTLFQGLDLPRDWAETGQAMLVLVDDPEVSKESPVIVIARHRAEHRADDWRKPAGFDPLTSTDEKEFSAMLAALRAGRSGVRTMEYAGEECLWAWGAAAPGHPVPVVILPRRTVVARARDAETHVMSKITGMLKWTGLLVIVVVLLVVWAAIVRSRKLTRPVRRLSEAADQIAEGEYSTFVAIDTGDELQHLGERFNEIGPRLEERQRMKQALALAEEIQQHLLPEAAPTLPGFDIAGRSVYCDETGGDYYDFIELVDIGPDRLGIAVGDVSGHGIGAALLMASARAVLRAHAVLHGENLSGLFAALNRHLVRDTGSSRFMTLFYGDLDATCNTLRWTSAGHEPALHYKAATGEIHELANTGMPLGVIAEAVFEQAGPVTLRPGDVVIVGTDGVWESRNTEGELFGRDRVKDLLARNADAPADQIYKTIVETVCTWRGSRPQEDDVTLVVMRKTEE